MFMLSMLMILTLQRPMFLCCWCPCPWDTSCCLRPCYCWRLRCCLSVYDFPSVSDVPTAAYDSANVCPCCCWLPYFASVPAVPAILTVAIAAALLQTVADFASPMFLVYPSLLAFLLLLACLLVLAWAAVASIYSILVATCCSFGTFIDFIAFLLLMLSLLLMRPCCWIQCFFWPPCYRTDRFSDFGLTKYQLLGQLIRETVGKSNIVYKALNLWHCRTQSASESFNL